MKSKLLSLVSAVCLVAFAAGIAKAATTGSVPVSASISAVADLTIMPYIGASTTDQIRFGVLPSATTDNWTTAGVVAPAYVKVGFIDNGVWEIKLYTNNFATEPSTTTWGYQYGGLVGKSGNKIPLAWQAEESNPAPVAGNPSAPASGWLYVKDKSDKDDPSTTGQNESYSTADLGGYTNIAFGSATYANFVDPNVPSGTPNPILGNDFKVYVQALPFANADNTYATVLNFDLVNK